MATLVKGRVKFEEETSKAIFGYVKGSAEWAQILELDMYGNYSMNLYGDNVVELVEEFEALRDSAAGEVRALGKKYEGYTLADVLHTSDEGKQFLKLKLPENDYEGNPNEIKMYDAGGNLVDDWDKLVGNGSTVKIKYKVAPYYISSSKVVGLSTKFYAVQVIDLVEYKKGSTDSGFGDETDGQAPFDADAGKKVSEDF